MRFGVQKFDEAQLLHSAPDRGDGRRREAEVPLHPLAAKVEPAITQAERLVDAFLVELEWERRTRGDDLERVHLHLDPARPEVRIDGVGCALDDFSLDPEHVLVANVVRRFDRGGCALRVDDELTEPLPVTEVDEDEAAVIAAAMHPARQGDALADMLGTHLAAHQVAPDHGRSSSSTAARSVSSSTTTTCFAPSRDACVSWPFRDRPA